MVSNPPELFFQGKLSAKVLSRNGERGELIILIAKLGDDGLMDNSGAGNTPAPVL